MRQHGNIIVGTRSLDDLGRLQDAVRLGDRPLAMDPLRLDVVEPRALRRQAAGHDTNAAILFGSPVMLPDPAPDAGAGMPAGVVPNQQQRLLPLGSQFFAGPRKEGHRQLAHRPALREAEQHATGILTEQSVTGQGFRRSFGQPVPLLDQPQRLVRRGPGAHVRLRDPAPPALIAKADHPLGLARRPTDQPVSCPFLRAYSGSGLTIHRFARCQPTFSRFMQSRIVSSETCRSVMPCSKQTRAVLSRVQTLLGRPNCRGFWCKSAWRRSSFSPAINLLALLGRGDFRFKQSSPSASKTRMALRTLWSVIPKSRWMRYGVYPSALLSSIWQRRTTKPSAERSPFSRTRRSSGDRDRTNNGDFMPRFYTIPAITKTAPLEPH